jgi:mannose-6-phosphate isomerase-like protein (cupin superfamily)
VKALHCGPGEGRTFARPSTGGSVTVKIASEAVTVFETTRPAGDDGGPGLHSHVAFDETFYVVSGEWEFAAGDDRIIAGAGETVHLPRGIFHSFRSTGREEGRLVGIAVPGGIEDFFEEAAQTADDAGAGRRHGIEWAGADR